MLEQTIRAVVYKEGDWWVIRCLEYGFVTVTKRREDVPSEIRRFVLVQVAASLKYGIEPFRGYAPAPRRYWEMYEKANPWEEPLPPVELPGDLGPNPTLEARLAA
ncbi:MAG TPA: hypothetical protein VE685_15530 [Thermoanaerobaculia bacterium]|nr:hypothetical protein [Thermoanaerobaculia bacterium]